MRGNVTFTCNSTSGTDLLWSLNVTVAMEYFRILSNTAGLNDRPGFSVSNESTVNPASFTWHHISLANNPSSVECRDLSIQDGSKNHAVVMILVEGELSRRVYLVQDGTKVEINYNWLFAYPVCTMQAGVFKDLSDMHSFVISETWINTHNSPTLHICHKYHYYCSVVSRVQ